MSHTNLRVAQRARVGASLGGVFLVGSAAFLAGRAVSSRPGPQSGPSLGQELPRVVVYSEASGPRLLLAEMDPTRSTTLIIFAIGCRSCSAEWEIWNDLAAVYREEVILLAVDQTFRSVESLLGRPGSGTRLFLLDAQGRTLLRVTSFPTILRVDSTARVSGVWSGPKATIQLERILAAKEDGG